MYLLNKKMDLQVVVAETKQSITLNALSSDTVLMLKHQIHEMVGLPVEKQKILYRGKYLEDDMLLSNYNIVSGSMMFVSTPIRR